MASDSQSKSQTKAILLVEDDMFLSDLYSRVLRQEGYTIINAYDGNEGLECAQQKPSLILLDIMMPKLDGITALKKLKLDETTKAIPVVLLTNLGQGSVIQEAFADGAQGYLMKMRIDPYDLPKIIKPFLIDPTYTMDFQLLDLE